MTSATINVADEKWLSTADLMKKFKFKQAGSITRLYRQGLKCAKIGKRFMVREADLQAWMLLNRDKISSNLNPK